MGVGDALLRLLYVKLRPPPRFYQRAARLACSLAEGIVVDVGGATGLLYHALVESCRPSLYIILDPDVVLLAEAERGAAVERVAGDARRPPFRGMRAVAVFHDSLHHIPGWRSALADLLAPYECIVVEDYDVSTLRGRLLALAERLLGFPAEFATRRLLERLVTAAGFRVLGSEGNFPYTIWACRRREKRGASEAKNVTRGGV